MVQENRDGQTTRKQHHISHILMCLLRIVFVFSTDAVLCLSHMDVHNSRRLEFILRCSGGSSPCSLGKTAQFCLAPWEGKKIARDMGRRARKQASTNHGEMMEMTLNKECYNCCSGRTCN